MVIEDLLCYGASEVCRTASLVDVCILPVSLYVEVPIVLHEVPVDEVAVDIDIHRFGNVQAGVIDQSLSRGWDGCDGQDKQD